MLVHRISKSLSPRVRRWKCSAKSKHKHELAGGCRKGTGICMLDFQYVREVTTVTGNGHFKERSADNTSSLQLVSAGSGSLT